MIGTYNKYEVEGMRANHGSQHQRLHRPEESRTRHLPGLPEWFSRLKLKG